MKFPHPPWRPETVLVLVALALATVYNVPFWLHVLAAAPVTGAAGLAFLGGALGLLVAAFTLVLGLVPLRWLGRPLLSLLLPLAALTAYFMNQYGVAIDDRMIQNVFETDRAEVMQLLSVKMVAYVLVLGVLPVVLLWKVPLRVQPWWPALRARLVALAVCLALLGMIALFFYQGFASLLRNHRDLRYYLVPPNFLNGLRHYWSDSREAPVVLQPVALDAHRTPVAQRRPRPALVVLVIGETARAQNFSLLGYGRDTNPELRRVPDLIAFAHAESCGTETAVSLPCMLSDLGRRGYSLRTARARENLLDVVRRAGVDVLWVENQSGCKRTCERVPRLETRTAPLPGLCRADECHDAILIPVLQRVLAAPRRDTLLVLHQMGSHGPAYYLRYPPAFERFTPVCRTNLLDKCTPEQIRNTYDNTILYTDHVLAGLIATLRAAPAWDSALLYMSDHGESLGEYGLYLHGAPRLLAPAYQTHIPALAWLSPQFQQDSGIRRECVARAQAAPVSHDNLFHSVLGLFDVRTHVYVPTLDLFGRCRPRR